MTTRKYAVIVLLVLTLAACGGSDFEWFPDPLDTTAPVVSVSHLGTVFANNTTFHTASLPITVTFSANEPATVYYTTNGSTPTTATGTTATIAATNGNAGGPQIDTSNTKLMVLGKDPTGNQSAVRYYRIISP